MKISLNTSALITVILTGLFIPSTTVCRAQSEPESANVVVVSTMPTTGTFWSMQLPDFPPLPYDPWNLQLYSDGTPGNYYYDDRSVDYGALSPAMAASASQSVSGAMEQQGGPPIPPGGGTNGGGGGSPPPPLPLLNPGTNLWLLIAQVSNTVVVTFSNTVAHSNYLLLAATNLTGPWITNQSLVATSTVAVAAPIWTSDATAMFFLGVQAPPPTPGTLRWKTFLANGGSDQFGSGLDASPAIGPTGMIYLPTANGNLLAIDPVFGDVRWAANIFTLDPTDAAYLQTAEMTGSAAVGQEGTIYAGYTDGHLYSFNPDGSTNWTRNLGAFSAEYSTPAIGSNGIIYAATDESTPGREFSPITGLTAFNPDGTTNWFFQPQDLYYNNAGDVDSSPAVGSDGTIYFLAEGHRLYALSPEGQLKWFLPVPGDMEPDSSPAIAADGTILVGSNSKFFYAVNPDGSLKWIVNFHDPPQDGDAIIEGTPAIGADGVIYTGSGGPTDGNPGNLYALNPDGSVKWVYTAPRYATMSSPALAADGTVYIGSLDGTLYAVTNGALAWSYTTGGEIISSPAIGPNGSVYVASEDGNLYSFWGSAPLATNAPWPMFRQNPAQTGQAPTVNPSSDCGAPFVFDAANDGAGDFTFSITGLPGSSHWNVYASTNLATNNWTLLAANLALDPATGNTNFTDTTVAGLSQKFYILYRSNCCSQVIGFVNIITVPGTNLIADQLYQVDDSILTYTLLSPMNTLDALFVLAWGPAQNGTEVYKWNGTGFDAATNAWSSQPYWPDNRGYITLLPGTAALMNNVSAGEFTNTFVGLVREQQVFQIQRGTNYLSATIPAAGAVTNVTGYAPHNGDTIQLWSAASHGFVSYTYNSNTWSPATPVVEVGGGFVLITTNSYTWTNTWQQCP